MSLRMRATTYRILITPLLEINYTHCVVLMQYDIFNKNNQLLKMNIFGKARNRRCIPGRIDDGHYDGSRALYRRLPDDHGYGIQKARL